MHSLDTPIMKAGAAFLCGYYAQYQTQSLYEYVKCRFYGTPCTSLLDKEIIIQWVQCENKHDVFINSILSVALSALFGYFGFSKSNQIGYLAPVTALCLGFIRMIESKPDNIGINNIIYRGDVGQLSRSPLLDYIFPAVPYPVFGSFFNYLRYRAKVLHV